MKKTFFDFYKILKQKHQNFFCTEFVNSKSFDDLIYELFKDSSLRFVAYSGQLQILCDIVENVRNTPEIYNNYSTKDKKKVNRFLKYLRNIIINANEITINIVILKEIIEQK